MDDAAASPSRFLEAEALLGLREELCDADLKNLAASLDEQLEADAKLCWQFGQMRIQILDAVRSKPHKVMKKPGGKFKSEDEALEYEFNNVYSRFYIAARNGLAGGEQAAAGPFTAAYDKMMKELTEKGMQAELGSAMSTLEGLPPSPPCLSAFLATLERVEVKSEEAQDGEAQAAMLANYSVQGCLMQVPLDVEQKLQTAARAFVNKYLSGCEEEALKTYAMSIFRVSICNYIYASSSLYWGFGPEVYSKASQLGAALECYASPFNHRLPVFCSPCQPLDMALGSLGSFYGLRVDEFAARLPAGSMLVANPPYMETELLSCAEYLGKLSTKLPKLTAMSIYPNWQGAAGLTEYDRLVKDRGGFALKLGRNAHSYYDYQKCRRVAATFESMAYGLNPTAGSKREADMKEILAALSHKRTADEAGVSAGPASKAARRRGAQTQK